MSQKNINTYNEKSLHAALKKMYLKKGYESEVKVNGYIVDILTDEDLIIEIQTGSFSKIKKKLSVLLQKYKIKLVYPLAYEKHLIIYDKLGQDILYKRKSPKKQTIDNIVNELIRIKPILSHKNFYFDVVFTIENEIRKNDGKGSWRRKGISIVDRKLIDVFKIQSFTRKNDYRCLIPDNCAKQFTNKQLAKTADISIRKAQKITYCLAELGLIKKINAKGREYVYEKW